MITADDILRLSVADLQTVAKEVTDEDWSVAIRGMSPELRQHVTNSLGTISQALAVENSQQRIAEVIERLVDAGEVSLAESA